MLISAQGALAAGENGIAYAEILPDRIIQDALPTSMSFSADYTEVTVDRVEGAVVDESLYPVTPVDSYSGGTVDPETVYRDMGDRYDSEAMVVVAAAKDPDAREPEPAVIAFDSYSGQQVNVTYPSGMTQLMVYTEDRIFLLINQPASIRRRLEQDSEDKASARVARQRSRVSVPQTVSPPIEIINVN